MSTPILVERTQEETLRIVAATAIEAQDYPRFLYEMMPFLVTEALRYRIDPAVIIAQSIHETGWGEFGGVVPPHYHNTCGLKTRDGGGNDDPDAHQRFPSWHAGARAHAQHLLAYAGVDLDPYDLELTPRAIWVRQANEQSGPAKTVEELGGRWAPSDTYGERVADKVTMLLARANL